jgi:UrcA family protein
LLSESTGRIAIRAAILSAIVAIPFSSSQRMVRRGGRRTLVMNIIATLVAAASAVTFVVPAHAQDISSARVVTRDLDLNTAHGQRILKLRIARAASTVCNGVNERFDAKVRVAQRQCRQATIGQALASVPPTTRLAAR